MEMLYLHAIFPGSLQDYLFENWYKHIMET